MATRASISYRDAEAHKRLMAAVGTLANGAKVAPPASPAHVRDPAYRAMAEREWLAATLESIVAAQAGD